MPVTSLQIALDRTTRIYYAGEVVRGHVTLETAGDVACRGCAVRFTGKGVVQWHTQSGDNRIDYIGSTLFQSQSNTLEGNFYRSALLDEAGSEALFDMVPGSGVIQIPCDAHEEHNLRLIVRVICYDWRKREHLMGEILLDVPRLVQSKDKQSFLLTRRGRPESGSVTLSARFVPLDDLFTAQSGESSTARKPLCLQLVVHEAKELRKADWVGKKDVYVQVYRVPEEGIKQGKALPEPTSKMTLPNGRFVYPFAFRLETDAPPSVQFPVSDYAYIRYDVYAFVDFAFSKNPSHRVEISVVPNRPVPTKRLLQPAMERVNEQMVYNCNCCCYPFGKVNGLVNTVLSLDRRSFAPGERMDFSGTVVESLAAQDLFVTIQLIQIVGMFTLRGSSMTRKIISPLWVGKVRPNETFRADTVPELQNIKMPALHPSFDGGVHETYSNRHYPCLKWEYVLELRAGRTAGRSGGDALSVLPVLVAAAAPYPWVLEEARQLSRETNVVFNPWEIFNDAVNGANASDTTPRITVSTKPLFGQFYFAW